MPRAPSYNPNQVGPAETTGVRFRTPDFADSPIAIALDGAAKVLGKYAEMKDGLELEQDKTDVGSGTLSFQDEAGEVLANAKATRGVDAGAAYKAAEERLLKTRQSLLTQARSPRARKMLQERTDAYLTSYRAELAQHEVTETRAAASETFGAQAVMAREEAARLWMQPEAVAAQVQLGREAIRERERLSGSSPEVAAKAEHEYESSVHRGVVESLQAKGDVDGALDYGQAHLGNLTLGDLTSVSAGLRGAIETRQASTDAQWAIGQGGPVPATSPGAKYTPPVKNGRITSAYGVERGKGRAHNGVDFAAPEGSAVSPLAGGVVVAVGWDARSGNFVIVDHGDGVTTSYAHLGTHSVKRGDRVTGTTMLGPVGMTGNTSGPHVHVVARKNGKPVDPMQFIGRNAPSAQAAGEWDKRSAYQSIDSKADWSFERKQRAKQWIDQEFSRKDSIDAREEREADDEAKKIIVGLGDRFTSFDQIPKNVRDRMSIDAVSSFSDMAKANSAPAPVAANGPEFLRLQRISIESPEQFAQMDINRSASYLTPGEFARLDADQARIAKGGSKEVSIRTAIAGHINTFATPDMNLTGERNKSDWLEVYRVMEATVSQGTGGKRMPTDKELDDAFALATRTVTVKRPGMLWGVNETSVRAHDMSVADIPKAVLSQIDDSLRRHGLPLNDANRIALYVERVSGQ